MAEEPAEQEKPKTSETPKPTEEKPEFKPPDGFGPDFVNRAAGEGRRERRDE